ncbi:MAG: 16S rRNA (adenine(1518)-N(6)/adenine(1519)-N(6))-dimethyltransferase RsmA [Desulfomicrobium sp.]|nr:16S rRNA (adenine(1518)-N(6)/adenine(1519)-N(6))-dimethyltransferase RsmA [Desulfomicrobium sp.]
MTAGPGAGWSGNAGCIAVDRSSFLAPKRSLGQNFLSDPNICRRIVASLELGPKDPVLEIGPGRGALTRILAGHDGPVMALEKDSELVRWVKAQFPVVGVVHADGLDFCWEGTRGLPGLSLIGNLPYNVASPMIWEMVSRCRSWKSMLFMVQKEVALRLTAEAGCKAYGALSAWVGNFARAQYVFTVPPHVFRPQPKVDSAIVRFLPRPDPAWDDGPALSFTVKILFQQRRKQLGTILKSHWSPDVEAWCADMGVDRRVRPEELGPDALRSLARVLGRARKLSKD